MKKLKAAISPPHSSTKNLYYVTILAKCPLPAQCQSYEKLPYAILNGELTESVEICERYGFNGKLGVWAIRELQDQMGRVER